MKIQLNFNIYQRLMGDLYISFLTNSPYRTEYGIGPALKSSKGSPEKFVEIRGLRPL